MNRLRRYLSRRRARRVLPDVAAAVAEHTIENKGKCSLVLARQLLRVARKAGV